MDVEDIDDAAEVQAGPAVRARLYRRRAAELEAEGAQSVLPMVQSKYREAAERFLALAAAEESVASRKAGGGTPGGGEAVRLSLGPLLAFLRAEPPRD